MTPAGCGRVVVGVDDSPAGLRALRASVCQARQRDQELVAVRAFRLPQDPEATHGLRLHGLPPTCDPSSYGQPFKPSQAWLHELARCERQAQRTVAEAFAQAMGAIPDVIRVDRQVAPGSPGPVLASIAWQDTDLLVVGAPGSHRWALLDRSVGRYCVAQATCPVLLVPPPGMARELSGHRRRRRRELDRLLTADPR